MEKISKKELLNTKKNILNLKKTIVPIVAVSMLVGCSANSNSTNSNTDKVEANKSSSYSTLIILRNDHALLIEAVDYHYFTNGYTVYLNDDHSECITVLKDNYNASIIMVSGANSLERAKEVASGLIGEEAVIEVYGSDTKTLTYSEN